MNFTRLMMLVLALTVAACSSGEDSDDASTASDSSSASGGPESSDGIASRMVSDEPEGAKPLVDVKSSASVGDDVTFVARIGGRAKPFVDGRAVMVVMDPAIPSCADNPGDSCAIPWDYCCETTETITANAATVRVVGPDGDPVKTSFADAGFAGLDRLTLTGKVAEKDDAGRFVVDVASIYRHEAN